MRRCFTERDGSNLCGTEERDFSFQCPSSHSRDASIGGLDARIHRERPVARFQAEFPAAAECRGGIRLGPDLRHPIMPFDYDKLMGCRRETSQRYTVRDTMLYALGVGAGIDADTPDKLRFVYEEQLDALPTMSVVLATPGFWLREPQYGIAWKKILHAEQSMLVHMPLAVCGEVISVLTVDAIYDKGAKIGALLYTCRQLWEKTSGNLLATLRQAIFLRGDGGVGGSTTESPQPHPMPVGRPADQSITLPTRPEQALLYRLSGDYNPLHADPDVARVGGFEQADPPWLGYLRGGGPRHVERPLR